MNTALTVKQERRLRLANVVHDWGHLESWQELYYYQLLYNNKTEIVAIGNLAKKNNIAIKNGVGRVRLPFNDFVCRKYLVTSILKRFHKALEAKKALAK
jgi:hypothetical protein